jgi:DNA-3-methyladenine glycosylase II
MLLSLIGKDVPDAFTTLAQTICHQQLSLKVCQGMFKRLLELCGNRELKLLDPDRVASAKPEKIREVAQLSFRKINYIQKLAERFISGDLTSSFFSEASDQEVREALSSLVGIGEWTTEMFLIFQLQRHGAVIYGDVAFQKALRMVYDLRPPPEVTRYCEVAWSPTREQMQECVMRWGPYSSIASLYMLRLADNENSAIVLPDLEYAYPSTENVVIDIEETEDRTSPPEEESRKRKKTNSDSSRRYDQSSKLAKFNMDLNKASPSTDMKPTTFNKLSHNSDTVLDIT